MLAKITRVLTAVTIVLQSVVALLNLRLNRQKPATT